MRRFDPLFGVLALLALTAAARAQYYQPQPYYYGYPQYYAPAYPYGAMYPNQAMPTYQPGFYQSPPVYYTAPTYTKAPPMTVAKPALRQGSPTPAPAVTIPPSRPAGNDKTGTIRESAPQPLPVEEPAPIDDGPPRRAAVGDRANYTITAFVAAMPFEPNTGTGNRLWVKGDDLLWWVRKGGPTFSLVTVDSNPGTATSGSITSPTARSLFGESGFDYRAFNGMRVTLGGWLDTDQRFGLEGSGFLLEKRTARFSASSDAAGNPALYFPAFNQFRNREDSLIISDPTLPLAGSVDIASTLQLWGGEFNSVFHLIRTNGWDIEILAGFRYLDMYESLQIQNAASGFGVSTTLVDRFQTRDQFYGPQLGTRIGYSWNRLSAGLSAKIALGATHEVVEVRGFNTQPAGAFNGGFFTQPSNIGRANYSALSAIPQIGGTLGYGVTQRLSIFAGYDFLFWSQVARAGDQLDRTLNLTQSSAFGVNALIGASRPDHLFVRSDFWAQGASFGLQYRY